MAMRRGLVAAADLLFITGLVCAGFMVLPWLAWKWLTEPRMWREPKDVGLGWYEHP